MSVLDAFHPAVRAWFERRFPLGPTEPQAQGWPAIAGGEDTLIAAPTGSGKTLAAFLVMIDRLLRERADAVAGEEATEVVYVSPLKALAADIQQNLETPLAEIRATAAAMGLAAPALRALLRTGDTPSSARAAMIKRPPHLLVTTPESLYLLVTSAKSRERLRSVRAVIVDEIHAVARDKRGAHLALTLERLDALCERRPQRIGLSATQRPIEAIARLLVGAGEGRTRRRRRPGVPGDRPRAPPGARPGPRSAADPARGRRVARAVGRDPRHDRGARRPASHHARLRQHPPARRAARPPARRARGRGPRGGASRQPLEGPAAQARGAAPGGRPEGPRRHGLARAGHRHRSRRARLPDRLAPEPRDVPAAGRALGPRAGRHAEGPPLSDHARRAGGERGAPARRARGPPRPCPPAGGAARHPRPADRGRRAPARPGPRTISTRSRAGPRPLPTCPARTSTPWSRCSRRASRPAAAGGAPGSIATW